MIGLPTYINDSIQNNQNNLTDVDESLINVLKRVGILILSVTVPYFLSLGIRIISLQLEKWVDKLIKKYPEHKDAILLISNVLKDSLDDCKKCKQFITNTEQQKPSPYYDIKDYEDEILKCIQSAEDKEKVSNLFNFIESKEFKEVVDEI